jgi:hypothetical protein
VTASRWEAVGRLGAPTIKCEHCAATMLAALPQRRDHPVPQGRAPIRSAYWRVEERLRSWSVSALPARAWVCCSEGCAQELAAKRDRNYGRRTPRIRHSIHGPVEAYVES